MRDLRAQSDARIAKIKSMGYEVEVMSECLLEKKLKESTEMAKFFRETCVKHLTPLLPRESVMGGRTEQFRYERERGRESMTR